MRKFLIIYKTHIIESRLTIKCHKLFQGSKTTFYSSCYCHVLWDTQNKKNAFLIFLDKFTDLMKACMKGNKDEYEGCKTEYIKQEIILLQRNQRNAMYKHYCALPDALKPSFY